MTEVLDDSPETDRDGLTRRNVLRAGAVGVAAVGVGAGKVLMTAVPDRPAGSRRPDGVFDAASIALADAIYIEAFPTSPLILNPFTDPLLIPQAADAGAGLGVRDLAAAAGSGPGPAELVRQRDAPDLAERDRVARTRSSTRSTCWSGRTRSPPRRCCRSTATASRRLVRRGRQHLPGRHRADAAAVSTIYGFNGTFPGPRINAEYGKPVLVRFENHLDENPLNLDRQDFGAPDYSFLTHLHNGHTAPESDGNPHYSMLFGPKAPGLPGPSRSSTTCT